MRYKIVGILNILFSVIYSLTQLGILIFVYPKMFSLYREMDAEYPVDTRYYPIISLAFIALYLAVGYVGFLLLKRPTHKLFVLGLVSLLAILLFAGYSMCVSVLSVVNPLYELTSSL